MKIAIASDGDLVARHFGRCPEYTIVETEDGKILKKETIPNPGHQPGFLPRFLSDMGCNVILSGGMGPNAIDRFRQNNIDSVIGVSGNIDDVIRAFIDGTLETGESRCNHGANGHPHHCGGY